MDAELEKIRKLYPGYDNVKLNPTSFGERLRQIRKERGETQDEFASIIGTSKQVHSRYESDRRIPKISLAEKYAQALGVSVDYLMGKGAPQEAAFDSMCTQKDKPFYKIFIDVTLEMGLLIPDIVRITGLTDWQVRTIIFRRMKEAPLPIALQFSRTLDVPLEVWTGNEAYKAGELTTEAREVARAYDKAAPKDKTMVRMLSNRPILSMAVTISVGRVAAVEMLPPRLPITMVAADAEYDGHDLHTALHGQLCQNEPDKMPQGKFRPLEVPKAGGALDGTRRWRRTAPAGRTQRRQGRCECRL